MYEMPVSHPYGHDTKLPRELNESIYRDIRVLRIGSTESASGTTGSLLDSAWLLSEASMQSRIRLNDGSAL
jgi:hypothetical protein